MIDPAFFYDTPLPRDEFDRLLRDAVHELDTPAGQEIFEQIAWFLRKYPTPLARLKYARRKYEEAVRMQGLAAQSVKTR